MTRPASPLRIVNTDAFVAQLDAIPEMGPPQGSAFGWDDRLFLGMDVKEAIDYNDWASRDLDELLKRDYRSRQIEAVQTLPIMAATRKWEANKGDSGELDHLQRIFSDDPLDGGCRTALDTIEGQMTSAFHFRKSFWEVAWEPGVGDLDGKVIPGEIGFRPQTTCRTRRNPKTGAVVGFEQEPLYIGPDMQPGAFPVKIDSDKGRALIYVHGERRDPINGISDMDVPYWAWRTKQKIMLLWFQFLEGVALPRVVAMAQEGSVGIAQKIAAARNSGVIPIDIPSPESVKIQQLDLSGKGADQFMAAIRWLDGCASGANLAGFLDLTQNATDGNGPVGVHLSKDASDFFLQTLEAKKREMERWERCEIFAPVLRYNFGPGAKVPYRRFEPLNAEDKSSAVTMLQALLSSRDPALVPPEFIGQLAEMVGTYLGMDVGGLADQFVKAAKDAEAKAAQMASQMGNPNGPGGKIAATNAVVSKAQKVLATHKAKTA